MTGLKVDSVIKLDKIATLSKSLIIGELGEIGSSIKDEGHVNITISNDYSTT